MDLSAVAQRGVVPVRADRLGRAGPTPKAPRGPRWRRTSHGFHVPAYVDSSRVDQRIVEAAAVLQEHHGGVTGWAGLAWDHARWFRTAGGPVRPVVLAVGGNRVVRPQPAYGI